MNILLSSTSTGCIDVFNAIPKEVIDLISKVVLVIITACLTHWFDSKKFLKEQHAKIIGESSKEKIQALKQIRNCISILNTYEDLNLIDTDTLINSQPICIPASCKSYQTLFDIMNKLNTFHSEYAQFLNHKSFICIVLIRNFFRDYAMKCKFFKFSERDLRNISFWLYEDIRLWYRVLDSELIKSMNKATGKYYSHSGAIYKVLLMLYGFRFKKTLPYKYLACFKEGASKETIIKSMFEAATAKSR